MCRDESDGQVDEAVEGALRRVIYRGVVDGGEVVEDDCRYFID